MTPEEQHKTSVRVLKVIRADDQGYPNAVIPTRFNLFTQEHEGAASREEALQWLLRNGWVIAFDISQSGQVRAMGHRWYETGLEYPKVDRKLILEFGDTLAEVRALAIVAAVDAMGKK